MAELAPNGNADPSQSPAKIPSVPVPRAGPNGLDAGGAGDGDDGAESEDEVEVEAGPSSPSPKRSTAKAQPLVPAATPSSSSTAIPAEKPSSPIAISKPLIPADPFSPPPSAGSLNASAILSPPGNATARALNRASIDSNRSSLPDDADRVGHLEAELAQVRNEKDVLSGQYRGLLGKLTAMRQSLGDKLREDAEELDRRETAINTLNSTNESLSQTITTLQTELESSSAECTSLQSQLAQLRSQSDSSSSDVLSLTREMRELRGEMERLRIEREEWEAEAGRERERREYLEEEIRQMERREREARREAERATDEAEGERTRGNNLQEVLSEFQAAKDSELRSATQDLEKQLQAAATSLSEFKLRCANAETRLSEVSGDAGRSSKLEKEIKEKERLISKLRHDAVVNNEHLTEALRRLRKNSSDNNVDRRLVTNILLSFLNASRGDTKRFEMLNILSTILTWDDVEREKAGLQRVGQGGGKGAGGAERPKMGGPKGSGREEGRSAEEEAAMNESFSNLFVEFLLKEASQGQPRRPDTSGPLPSPTQSLSASVSRAHSPLTPTHPPLPPPSLPSFSPTGTGASTPFFGRERTFSSIGGVSGGLMSPPIQPPPPLPGQTPGRKGSYNLSSALSGDKTPT